MNYLRKQPESVSLDRSGSQGPLPHSASMPEMHPLLNGGQTQFDSNIILDHLLGPASNGFHYTEMPDSFFFVCSSQLTILFDNILMIILWFVSIYSIYSDEFHLSLSLSSFYSISYLTALLVRLLCFE